MGFGYQKDFSSAGDYAKSAFFGGLFGAANTGKAATSIAKEGKLTMGTELRLLGRESKELAKNAKQVAKDFGEGFLKPLPKTMNGFVDPLSPVLYQAGARTVNGVKNSVSKARAKTGETAATQSGKQIHKELAAERRLSDEWDNVNEPIKTSTGENIEVPTRVDLKTGEPVIRKGNQTANPDAVSYKYETILDDKPLGRNVLAKDRQEIIRFITAYQKRVGKLPKRIAIQRYNPKTGEPVQTDLYTPKDFLPKE